MLKLKYFFDDRDLVKMLLGNWQHDIESLDLLDSYRISSNAVYPFKQNGSIKFLRFSPFDEKLKCNLIGELDFINYLKTKEYPVLNISNSKNGQELIEISTPWGNYYAVVFDRVKGEQLGKIEYTTTICKIHGKALGKLHRLSSDYNPVKKLRWSYEDVLQWVEGQLTKFPQEALARREAEFLFTSLSRLPKDNSLYGLIHYDFELDNLFYDVDNDILSVIDFDDAMYHWYVMDIERALESICSELGYKDLSIYRDYFMEGYREEFNVSEELLSYIPLFRRFANLYSYTRILRASSEIWENEPEWLTSLRSKLAFAMEQRSKEFGSSI